MAIQLCPVDTANVHPRNILGSSSSFDRERLSPFGSLSSRCWETVVYITLSSGPENTQRARCGCNRAVLAEVGDGDGLRAIRIRSRTPQLAGLPVADVLAADALLFC